MLHYEGLVGVIADFSKPEALCFQRLILLEPLYIDLNKEPEKIEDVEAVAVIGGDGFFLEAVHQFFSYKKPFYGVNYGSVGFLLNAKMDAANLRSKIQSAAEIKLHFLKAKIQTETESITSLAMNEVTLFRSTGQLAKIKVFIDEKIRIKELAADGISLSTAAGSTAYNLSLQGPIFPPEANVLSLCAISPFRPRHFRGALLLENSKVRLEVMEQNKRPVLATADFKHFKNVKSLEVSLSKKDFARVLFDKEAQLKEKILKEQFSI